MNSDQIRLGRLDLSATYFSTLPASQLPKMKNEITEFQATWKSDLQKIKTVSPETARAFGSLHLAMMKEGALSVKEKELIAMAIGLAQGCTECIFLHAEGAKKAGATREQVLEAAGVAVMMQGGPAFVHLPAVLAAFDHAPAPVT
jgi:AhpD family alkylhydroperoxidase